MGWNLGIHDRFLIEICKNLHGFVQTSVDLCKTPLASACLNHSSPESPYATAAQADGNQSAQHPIYFDDLVVTRCPARRKRFVQAELQFR
jgi:hypothetical protein